MILIAASMRLAKQFALVLCVVLLASCGKKSSLSDDQLHYVETTVKVLRLKGTADTSVNDATLKTKIVTLLSQEKFSDSSYVRFGRSLSDDPEGAQMVFEAIRDSFPGAQAGQ